MTRWETASTRLHKWNRRGKPLPYDVRTCSVCGLMAYRTSRYSPTWWVRFHAEPIAQRWGRMPGCSGEWLPEHRPGQNSPAPGRAAISVDDRATPAFAALGLRLRELRRVAIRNGWWDRNG